jgi:hypothetical protein
MKESTKKELSEQFKDYPNIFNAIESVVDGVEDRLSFYRQILNTDKIDYDFVSAYAILVLYNENRELIKEKIGIGY